MRLKECDAMTLGAVARAIGDGCQIWMVRRLFERGILPEPRRIGTCRVVSQTSVPRIRRLLVKFGYLRPTMEMASA